jgi:hypothetical protein
MKVPNEETVKEFKAELKALLKKYNAEIWSEVDGDTHGCNSVVGIDLGDTTVIRNE